MSIILGRSLYKKLQESVITVVEDCQTLTLSFIKEGCSRYTFTIINQEFIVFFVVSFKCCHVLDLLFYFIVLLVLRLSQLGHYGNTAIIFKIFRKVNSVWVITLTWSPFQLALLCVQVNYIICIFSVTSSHSLASALMWSKHLHAFERVHFYIHILTYMTLIILIIAKNVMFSRSFNNEYKGSSNSLVINDFSSAFL